MTEKEKMLNGLLYDPGDTELDGERALCKDLCWQFNQLRPSEHEKQDGLLRRLFGKAAGDFYIEPSFWCDYGYNVELGENFYANHNCVLLDCAKIIFGSNVLLGPGCGFYTAAHPLDAERRNQGLEYAKPITVGSSVWFGGGVQVMPGVKIGDNVVIGSGSVVTKDLPDNVLAAGNPCRVLRPLASGEDRSGLLRGRDGSPHP